MKFTKQQNRAEFQVEVVEYLKVRGGRHNNAFALQATPITNQALRMWLAIQGIWRNFNTLGIKTVDDYWDYEYNRDKAKK